MSPSNGPPVGVELAVVDGLLSGIRFRSDTTPAPLLDTIAAGLTGAPADLSAAALAARVRAAIPFGVDPGAASPEAVAIAVRGAVGTPPNLDRIGAFSVAEIDRLTARWKQLPWRLIPERLHPAGLNVALDEVLTDRVADGRRPPTLRFWRWAEPAVVIGRTQSLANEVDRPTADAAGVRVVRRMTGGGAMYIRPSGTITYSLILPDAAVAGLTIRQSYEACETWVILALRAIGIDAHHVPVNDIACAGGKIGGAAQARRRGVVLHHTTIAYDLDLAEMVAVLRTGREKLAKGTASAAKVVWPLARQTALPRDEIVARLFESFRQQYGGEPDEASAEELSAAEWLVGEKYGTAEWTRTFE